MNRIVLLLMTLVLAFAGDAFANPTVKTTAEVRTFDASLTRDQKVAAVRRFDAALSRATLASPFAKLVRSWQRLTMDKKIAALDGTLAPTESATTTGHTVGDIRGLRKRTATKAELDYLKTAGVLPGAKIAPTRSRTKRTELDY